MNICIYIYCIYIYIYTIYIYIYIYIPGALFGVPELRKLLAHNNLFLSLRSQVTTLPSSLLLSSLELSKKQV